MLAIVATDGGHGDVRWPVRAASSAASLLTDLSEAPSGSQTQWASVPTKRAS